MLTIAAPLLWALVGAMIVVPLALNVWMVNYERRQPGRGSRVPVGGRLLEPPVPHANTVPQYTTAERPRC